ncbi:MAG TPA: hypothetical protein VN648_19975, partial [Candidatus Methylomirabilis sp.]|nr:hypothetical protein [Candidatus Methylomirabilis sp.]
MSNSSGSNKTSFWDVLLRLLGLSRPSGNGGQPSQATTIPDSTTEPARVITSHVLLVIYDPVMDAQAGATLSRKMNWNSPDDLANTYIQDILEVSGGLARYEITQRLELNEFPA